MTHDEAFLQAIIDDPDDDTPRLIYADWLDERGDPRGEFIRVQCQLARLAEADPRRTELEARERTLLHRHEEHFIGGLWQSVEAWDFHPGVKDATPRGRVSRLLVDAWEFRRGFVERVTVDTPVFLEHAATLLRAAPIRHLEVMPWLSDITDETRGEEVGVALAEHLHFFRPLTLKLTGWAYPSPTTLARVLRHPNASALATLVLDSCFCDDGAAAVVAASAYLSRLAVLDLQFNLLSDSGLRSLASSCSLGELSVLDISECSHWDDPYSYAGLEALLESPWLRRLSSVRVDGWQLSEDERTRLRSQSGGRLRFI
jgi:uncharacterized protein (TIGR02996 family)